MWFNKNKEKNDGEAEDACWEYFQEVQRRFARQRFRGEDGGLPDGFGPFEGVYDQGTPEEKHFHGTPGDHRFRVVRRPFGDATNPSNKMIFRN